jgi:hypothetical protein
VLTNHVPLPRDFAPSDSVTEQDAVQVPPGLSTAPAQDAPVMAAPSLASMPMRDRWISAVAQELVEQDGTELDEQAVTEARAMAVAVIKPNDRRMAK